MALQAIVYANGSATFEGYVTFGGMNGNESAYINANGGASFKGVNVGTSHPAHRAECRTAGRICG